MCSAGGSRASVLCVLGGISWAGGIRVQERGVPGQGLRTRDCEGVSVVGVRAPSHPHPLNWGLQAQAFPVSSSKP